MTRDKQVSSRPEFLWGRHETVSMTSAVLTGQWPRIATSPVAPLCVLVIQVPALWGKHLATVWATFVYRTCTACVPRVAQSAFRRVYML